MESPNEPGRPTKSELLLKEGNKQGHKIAHWLTSVSRKRERDPEVSPISSTLESPAKKASLSITVGNENSSTATDASTPAQPSLGVCDSAASHTKMPHDSSSSADHDGTSNTTINVQERILEELRAVRCELSANSKENSLHFGAINKRLDDLEGKWSERWMEVDRRVGALETHVLNIQQTHEADKLNTSTSKAMERSFAEVVKCTARIERMEKEARKLNLIVRGLESKGENLLAKVNRFFEANFHLADKITEAKSLSHEKNIILIKVVDWECKQVIFKQKRDKLRNQNIYIEGDMTEKERRVEFKMREYARAQRAKGKIVSFGHQKVKVDGVWLQWSEADDDFIARPSPTSRVKNGDQKNGQTDTA